MMLNRRQFLLGASATLGSAVLPVFPFGYNPAEAAKLLTSHSITKTTEVELKKMRIAVYPKGITTGREIYALFDGLKKHGLNVFLADNDTVDGVDICVVSGWWPPKVLRYAQANQKNILVLEGGFIQPRKEWPSLGFNGLNGYAAFAPAADNGERFQKYHAHHLKPWKQHKSGYALLIGQVPGDRSLHGLNMNRWLQVMANRLNKTGIEVVYRPHPRVRKKADKTEKELFVPVGTRLSTGTLEQDIANAAYTVIYSSTTAVESVLAGVPAVVMSEGSIAWPVTSHDQKEPFYTPDRTKWCNDLAWRQWSKKELSNGTAWEHTKQVIVG
jgi:hypothetical protein